MFFKTSIPIVFTCLFLPILISAQKTTNPVRFDSLMESHVSGFKTVGVTDTSKAIVRVIVKETGRTGPAVQGATVLLRRDKDKMLGRVSNPDGRCNFMAAPAEYSVRVQLTGYRVLERTGLLFERGKVYELELRIAPN